jgi:ribonuclease D
MHQQTQIDRALEAAQRPLLLESPQQLREAVDQWADNELLGIDTEFVRERTYRAHLGLIQVSDGHTAWLADPVSLGSLDALNEMMNRSQTTKILHSCSEDLDVLSNTLGGLPGPMVDTQIACAMLGQPLQLGYHHAVKWIFDVEIDKDQTRSNWLKRPLTSHQLRYAAMDVVLLPMMLEVLRSRLEAIGRWEWLQEDVDRMKYNSLNPPAPENAYLRFSAVSRLDETTLKVLQALAAWREETAEKRDLARGFVISDIGLMRLAQSRPSSRNQIKDIADIHPGALRRYRETLLEIIATAQNSQSTPDSVKELSGAQKRQLKNMRKLVVSRSEQLNIDPALLASRKELEKLIRATADDQPLPERFMGWRNEVITGELLQVTV